VAEGEGGRGMVWIGDMVGVLVGVGVGGAVEQWSSGDRIGGRGRKWRRDWWKRE